MSKVHTPKLGTRVEIAEKLAAIKGEVAAEVNQEFFRRHPDWRERYGAAGVQRGFEDACYHLEYLAAAVETASAPLFENYARWTGRLLQSRGIAPTFVAENLEQIESALEKRLSPADFACARPLLRVGIEALLHPGDSALPEPDAAQSSQLFRAALLLGQRQAAVNIALEAIASGATPGDVYLELCSKALWEIGELWERNQISVADEHRATAIVQYVVAQVYSRLPLSSLDRGKVVVCGVEGESHQLGANIVADLLESDGWDVCFLGTNLPHRTILQKIADHRAGAVFISATMPFNLPNVRRLVADIRREFGPEIFIVLGGQAFATARSFFLEAGADAFAPTALAGTAMITERAASGDLGLAPQEQLE
jgi:methanogenic corrinoid protein MtbC1